ncbi:hypothetical protein E6P78_15815 [Streptomyces sp. A0958]|uniref:hypothetical protein n=1 Tax=Streptomyces sp. A0958 TaxID=2563101 RepID=UPI00109E75CF|nr:hypothetical protein [Streptomyces sp. A0958]THA67108.1 hypothetical protein E6P78_15815 [Streptomyces sp. A0958]
MKRLSEGADRLRGTGAPMALTWVFVLVALVSCCSPLSPREHSSSPGFAPASALAPWTDLTAVRTVVADAPGDRGVGDSCHGTSQHSTPMVLPGQPAPAAIPSAAVAVLPARPLTGGACIRGPSNDAVGDVDRLRLQVQRI